MLPPQQSQIRNFPLVFPPLGESPVRGLLVEIFGIHMIVCIARFINNMIVDFLRRVNAELPHFLEERLVGYQR